MNIRPLGIPQALLSLCTAFCLYACLSPADATAASRPGMPRTTGTLVSASNNAVDRKIATAFEQSQHREVIRLLESYPSGRTPSAKVLRIGSLSYLSLGKPGSALRTYERLVSTGNTDDADLLSEIAWGFITAQLRDRRESVRVTAFATMAQLGDPRSGPLFEDGLLDASVFVRAQAAEGLGRAGLAGGSTALRRALDDPAPAVRIAAINALGDAQAQDIREHLVRLARSGTGPEHVFALAGLVKLGSAEALQEIVEAATLPQPDIRMAAIGVLGRLKRPTTLSVLMQSVYDPNPAVRAFAAGALGEFGDPAGVPALTHALGDESAQVRGIASASMGRIGGRHARTLLRPLMRDPSPTVQVGAVEGLLRVGDGEATLLAADLAQHPDPAVRSATARAVGRAASTQAFSVLKLLVQDRHPRPRMAAARACGNVRQQEAVPLLKHTLHDPEPMVQVSGAGSLIRQLS